MLRMTAVLCAASFGLWAEKLPPAELLRMASSNPAAPQLRQAVLDSLPAADLQKGQGIVGEGPDFLWAAQGEQAPALVVDDQPVGTLKPLGAGLFYHVGKLQTGTSHAYYYNVGGKQIGGRTDVSAYGPDSYPQAGVPEGKISEKRVHTSKIYPGMQSDYWIYVPAQYNPQTPAALLVWQDGQSHVNRSGASHAQTVADNLIQQKKIPVMIQVFISPGKVGEKAMRSIEYDSVTDVYARYLRDEILADVAKEYNLRKDGYSRAAVPAVSARSTSPGFNRISSAAS